MSQSNDLWKLALSKLSEEDKQTIDFEHPEKLEVLSNLHQLTYDAKVECDKKRWRFTRRSGETVIVRDLLGKVIKWVDLFRQVGDVAMQYDPVHAALPWAGVRFLLQVCNTLVNRLTPAKILKIAVSDFSTFGSVIENVASISETLCRNSYAEAILHGSVSDVTKEMKNALIRLYAAILIYLSKAKRYFQQKTANEERVIKSVVDPRSDLDQYFNTINTAQVEVDRYLRLVNMQDQIENQKQLKDLLEQMDRPLNRMNITINEIWDSLDGSKRATILQWISAEPYIQHHREVKTDVLAGTGQWLLSNPTFKKWKEESASSILWLHGIIGSGKSKLTYVLNAGSGKKNSPCPFRSIVIEDAMQAHNAGQSPPPAYFYCSRNSAELARSNPAAILASFVRQLSCVEPGGPLLDPVTKLYQQREVQGFASGSLRIDESITLLTQLVEHYQLTTIVIDALDECDPEKRFELIDALETLLQESSCLVKVFASSRDDQDIVYRLQAYPNLEIDSNKNGEDIFSFVRAETRKLIQRRKILQYSSQKREMEDIITRKVSEGARGMFRWATLQLQSLCELKTDNAIQERVGRLPRHLESLYYEIFQKIESYPAFADRQVTKNAFIWLLCAQRILSSAEYLAAISIMSDGALSQISKDQILDMCCNLVVFDAELDTFRFAHLSVREFLEKQQQYDISSCTNLAIKTCLFCLIYGSNTPKVKAFLSALPESSSLAVSFARQFSNYSALYWLKHLQLLEERWIQADLKAILSLFLSTEEVGTPLHLWAERLPRLLKNLPYRGPQGQLRKNLEGSISEFGKVLFIACSFNFLEIAKQWVSERDSWPNLVNSRGLRPLESAVEAGSCEVAFFLLAHGSLRITDDVLVLAARHEEKGLELTSQLLDFQGKDKEISEQLVVESARNEGCGLELIKLLLSKREIPPSERVLEAGAGNKRLGVELLNLLLDRCSESFQITEPVVKAAVQNLDLCLELLTLLLNRRKSHLQISEAILRAAALNWYSGYEIFALLLDRQIDIAITQFVLTTVMDNHYSDISIMMLLLNRRSEDVQISEAIVEKAALVSDDAMVALLLERGGAEIVVTETIMQAAASNWRYGLHILNLLFDIQADVEFTDAVVIAALDSEMDCLEKAMLLFARRPNTPVTKEIILKALSKGPAAIEFVEMLLVRSKVEVNCQDESGMTPLHYAVIFGTIGDCNLARLLLERNASIDAQTKDGWTPLHLAINYEDLKLATYLLERKADVNAESGDGRTPLHCAIKRASLDLANLLLERKANIDHPDKEGWGPLHLAAEYGYVKVANLLLDQQANINIISKFGYTPLHIAVHNEKYEFARLLVERNAGVNCISKAGDTPLRSAIVNGSIDTVDFLISCGADLSTVDSYGRTCADWLSLLLPNSMHELAFEFDKKNSIPAETGLQQAVVKISSSLLSTCDDTVTTVYPGFGTLGRCLLFLGMDEEAKFAFEQAVTEDSNSEQLAHGVICDICDQNPIKGARFVCRTCPDTDLCSRCMFKYPNLNSLAVCKNHGFIEVNPHDFKRHQDSRIKEWLKYFNMPSASTIESPRNSMSEKEELSARTRQLRIAGASEELTNQPTTTTLFGMFEVSNINLMDTLQSCQRLEFLAYQTEERLQLTPERVSTVEISELVRLRALMGTMKKKMASQLT
ncbi:MAG: hypothetical protein Q9167_002409 [Letrouitia subvulpina]